MPEQDGQDIRRALARPGDGRTYDTLFSQEAMDAAVKEGTSTTERSLEVRRKILESDSIRLDGLYNRLRDPRDEDGAPTALSDRQKQTILLEMLALHLCSTVRAQAFVADCLSIRVRSEGKGGYRRFSVASMTDEMCAIMDGIATTPEERGRGGEVKHKAQIGEMGWWFLEANKRLDIIQAMLHIGAKNVDPGIFRGPVLDENGVPRKDLKTNKELVSDDLFEGDAARVSAPGGGERRRVSEFKQQREDGDAEVSAEALAAIERQTKEEMKKDRERTK
jgi:hypothetical protein